MGILEHQMDSGLHARLLWQTTIAWDPGARRRRGIRTFVMGISHERSKDEYQKVET